MPVLRSACIIIPTYNEAQNIKSLLDRLALQQLLHRREGIALSVLVVDDSSPDGTADIVRAYRNRRLPVKLLVRSEKTGLGDAYIAGMRAALAADPRPDVILEMDADGQHDPRDVYRLVRAIKSGADFAIGSRYVEHGSVPEPWGIRRRLLSRSANLYTRAILQTAGVKDCTGGFRAIRATLLNRIDLGSLLTKGYAFQVTLLDAAVSAGAIVVEIPIAFGERTRGESKMRFFDVAEGAMTLAGISVRRAARTVASAMQ